MFIELIGDANGKTIMINTDYVRTISRSNRPSCTELSMFSGQFTSEITVRGSYEDIAKMVLGAGLVGNK